MQPIDVTRRENLGLLIKAAGSQAALSETIGKAPAQISQWLNASINSKTGKPRVMSNAIAREIESKTGKPEGWMDQPARSEDLHTHGGSNVEFSAIEGVRRVPVISYVQAGMWTEIVNAFQHSDAADWLVTSDRHSRESFALTVRGNSMEPDFKEGDVVIIDPSIKPRPGSFVAAKNGREEATFKKYRPRSIDVLGNEIFELVPLNEDYPTMRSSEQHIEIIGTMVEHRRFFK
ncbi:S24 family peptidase [Comamonas fluminis]|uniref:S24 family peptidase n=1 Tax=Comamonas fluminis TaxID=2796366 RepID=UPI001FED111E|nr:S24 family peptidase [Comamonas fluminis]